MSSSAEYSKPSPISNTDSNSVSYNERKGPKYIVPSEEWLPEKQVLPFKFRGIYQQLQELPVRDDDVWVVTFPKSGTTWMLETVWLLTHGLDYEQAKTVPLANRMAHVEGSCVFATDGIPGISFDKTVSDMENLQQPRILKSHLFLDKLPKALTEPNAKAKIIYVARDPRDVCVSLFYFYRMLPKKEYHEATQTFDFFCEDFVNDRVGFGPFWQHVLDFWNRRSSSNIFFVKYEEMKADLGGVLDRLQAFLNVKPLSAVEKQQLVDHLSFNKMKENYSVNMKSSKFFRQQYAYSNEETNFFRKGKVGDWKEKMSPEMIKRFDEWIKRCLAHTDYSVEIGN